MQFVVCKRKTPVFDEWRRLVLNQAHTVCRKRFPASYVRQLFGEPEDSVDYLVIAYTMQTRREKKKGMVAWQRVEGFAMLSKKLLGPWTPPMWRWRPAEAKDHKHDPQAETVYTRHDKAGKVVETVYDDLDTVWKDKKETDFYHQPSIHILLLCARSQIGQALVARIEDVARSEGRACLSLGAADARLVHHYAKHYGFRATPPIGCAGASKKNDKEHDDEKHFIDDWNRDSETCGIFMSKCVKSKSLILKPKINAAAVRRDTGRRAGRHARGDESAASA